MIDPLERIENMIRLYGSETMGATKVSYDYEEGEEGGTRKDQNLFQSLVPALATDFLERLRETVGDEDAKHVLRILVISMFHSLGALNGIPPGLEAMAAAMAAPPSAMQVVRTAEGLAAEAEIAGLAVALELTEEVTDNAEG